MGAEASNRQKKIINALAAEEQSEIIVDRHRLFFDPVMDTVTVDRAAEDVPFAYKIIKCRMPYGLLKKMLDGDWDDLMGLQYL